MQNTLPGGVGIDPRVYTVYHSMGNFVTISSGMDVATSMLPTAPNLNTASAWAHEDINKAVAAGLVPKDLQSLYTQTTTRVEFCALAASLYESIKGEIAGRSNFVDTNDANVQKMAYIGVVSGVGNSKFDPNTKITREQAAAMLARLANAIGKPFAKIAPTFADNGQISSWAFEYVGQIQAALIMNGVGDNRFAPQNPYTREQSIITILRLFAAVK
jgi:hypothetical protein